MDARKRTSGRRFAVKCAAIVVTHGDADHFAGEDKPFFGRTAIADEQLYVVGLADDLAKVRDARMNMPFWAWNQALPVRSCSS